MLPAVAVVPLAAGSAGPGGITAARRAAAAVLGPLPRRMWAAGPGCSCGGAVWRGRGELMAQFWRRKAQQDTRDAQPAAVPADLVAWAQEVDVSRLSDRTVRDAEDYLKGYRYMNLDLSQQMGWRVIAAVEAQVTPSPPADAQPLDVIATVLALRRKQPGIG